MTEPEIEFDFNCSRFRRGIGAHRSPVRKAGRLRKGSRKRTRRQNRRRSKAGNARAVCKLTHPLDVRSKPLITEENYEERKRMRATIWTFPFTTAKKIIDGLVRKQDFA